MKKVHLGWKVEEKYKTLFYSFCEKYRQRSSTFHIYKHDASQKCVTLTLASVYALRSWCACQPWWQLYRLTCLRLLCPFHLQPLKKGIYLKDFFVSQFIAAFLSLHLISKSSLTDSFSSCVSVMNFWFAICGMLNTSQL